MAESPGHEVPSVRRHLVARLGRPSEVFEVSRAASERAPARTIQLATFTLDRGPIAVAMSSVGVSLAPMSDGRRAEGLLLFRDPPRAEHRESLHKLLAGFAGFTEMSPKPPRAGDVIRARTELARVGAMDALLCLPPTRLGADAHLVGTEGGGVIELFWLAPVFEVEASYALVHGVTAFSNLVAAQRTDLTDWRRGPANTDMRPDEAALLVARSHAAAAAPDGPSAPPVPPPRPRAAPGTGSFDAHDDGDAVVILRRPKLKAQRPATRRHRATAEPTLPATPDPPAPPPGPPPPHPRRSAPMKRAAAEEEDDRVVRFQLPKRPEPPLQARSAAPRPPGAEIAPPPEAPLSEAEAKRRRIEALKAKAREAAQRAAERRASAAGPPAE